MTNYLEAAAAVLKQVVDGNSTYATMIECARTYAMLAAIDKGLLPKEMAEDLYGQLRSNR